MFLRFTTVDGVEHFRDLRAGYRIDANGKPGDPLGVFLKLTYAPDGLPASSSVSYSVRGTIDAVHLAVLDMHRSGLGTIKADASPAPAAQ